MHGSSRNSERLRAGDTVGDQDEAARATHPNAYMTHGIVQAAWRQLGGNKGIRVGLDGTIAKRDLSTLDFKDRGHWIVLRWYVESCFKHIAIGQCHMSMSHMSHVTCHVT